MIDINKKLLIESLEEINKKEEIDITKNFDFTCLEIKSTSKPQLYCLYNRITKHLVDAFILTDQEKIQRRCRISLIENDDKKLIPRFEFFIWNKIENKRIEKNNNQDGKNNEKARVDLEKDGSDNFWKLIGFLATIPGMEVGKFGTYRIIDSNDYIAKFKTRAELEKIKELEKILTDLDFNEGMIKKALSEPRKKTIDDFRKLLEEDDYIDIYKKEKLILENGEEPIWHHFLKNNDWLLGLNVDIKFIADFTNEVNLGVQNTSGKGSPKTDLMGISDYTTLVELKTANTKFFTEIKKSTSRTNTWSFTDDLIDGISQCLGQKFDWDKNHKTKDLINNDNVLDQDTYRTVDPKTVFVVGNKQKELPLESKNIDILKKRETLERFRRNNRNIEIISYDELYERAYFIIYNKVAPKLKFKIENSSNNVF